MNQQFLVTNPQIRVLQLDGDIVAGQISSAQLIRFRPVDLVLLTHFISGANVMEVVNSLHKGPGRQLLASDPIPQSLVNRIQTLRQSQILKPLAVSGNRVSDMRPTLQRLEDCEHINQPGLDSRLRIPANIALKPDAGALSVWSAATRTKLFPDIRLQLLLFAFCKGRTVSDVIAEMKYLASEEECGKGIQWLSNQGLLYSAEDRLQGMVSPTSRNKPTPTGHALIGKGPRWQDIEADGRIPIYFTPHMENHYPLALGMIAAAIKDHDNGSLLERFQLLPISFLTPNELFSGPHRKFGTGIWLFSNYVWSLDINLKISGMLKARDPNSLSIHGGPSTPEYPGACADFMSKNTSVDIAVHGEGEVSIIEILQCIFRSEEGHLVFDSEGLAGVTGLTFRDRQAPETPLVTTEKRTRIRVPDSVPSPYLTGIFDSYDGRVEAAIIETNRGCPFGCTFCDWGSATRQKVRKFGMERIRDEIDWVGRNQVRVIWIADANFGMYDRDIELSEYIVATKNKYGFPQEVVVNYTKNTTRRLLEIIKAFSAGGIISQGIISIQTTDETTLEVINRKNIKTDTYDELARVFAEANLPLSTDLMTGLPGITPKAFDRDLQRYFDADVTAKAYPTQLLPNSPMADPAYMEKYKIKVDKDGFITSCYSFTEAELAGMNAMYAFFTIADGYSVLRYVLRYLQWDCGIPAMKVLHAMLDQVDSAPNKYPALTWAVRTFLNLKFMPGCWKVFYDEVAAFTHEHFDVPRDSAFDSVLLVNEMAMPDDSLSYPMSKQLEHDLVSWYEDHSAHGVREVRRLETYPPGVFEVDDPDSMSSIDMDYIQYDSHQFFWELRSSLARAKSVSDAKELARRRFAS